MQRVPRVKREKKVLSEHKAKLEPLVQKVHKDKKDPLVHRAYEVMMV